MVRVEEREAGSKILGCRAMRNEAIGVAGGGGSRTGGMKMHDGGRVE